MIRKSMGVGRLFVDLKKRWYVELFVDLTKKIMGVEQ